jgi:hypothetical protein
MFLDEHSNETKQLLMLWSPSRAQEGSNLDVGHMTSGGNVRLMPDENLTRDITDQVPAITVGTAIKLTSLLHASCSSYHQKRLGNSAHACAEAYIENSFETRFSMSVVALMI